MRYRNSYYTLHFDERPVLEYPGGQTVLELPRPEIGGKVPDRFLLEKSTESSLLDGGTEFRLIFRPAGKARLEMDVRCYTDSPFLRIRYRLAGEGSLTKRGETDNFRYTSFPLPDGEVSELQLSQYSRVGHAYRPLLISHPEAALPGEDARIAGPILVLEGKNHAWLCAYEHGGAVADDFLHFRVQWEGNRRRACLECGSGTYCNGHPFSDHHPYITPWFHLGTCIGGQESLWPLYRRFLLNNLPETSASRKPYIFYNTWNNQERNRAFRGRKYLQDLNTEQMCQEIEIAHRMGVDVFVVDTGWYRSTGDWEVDLERFPDDLARVRTLLDQYGMQLGLWFNPAAAAVSSRIVREHPEFRKERDGQPRSIGPVWETEESFGMCLASGYSEWFIEKLVDIGRKYGVRYFKWDAVDLHGCDSPHHFHGGSETSREERERNFRFQCGLSLANIAREVSLRLPGAIVDLDITEAGRFMGLGFLSSGKFFHMNNGPYYHDFDIPGARETYRDNWNVFFYPGAARSVVCRQSLSYDEYLPSLLFLSHFLPEKPLRSQKAALASMILGGDGIWGDLLELDHGDIQLFTDTLARYKLLAEDITLASPRRSGFLGASPEIHEKINPDTGRGVVVLFTREPVRAVYFTRPLPERACAEGADQWRRTQDGRLCLTVDLSEEDSRIVWVDLKGDFHENESKNL